MSFHEREKYEKLEWLINFHVISKEVISFEEAMTGNELHYEHRNSKHFVLDV